MKEVVQLDSQTSLSTAIEEKDKIYIQVFHHHIEILTPYGDGGKWGFAAGGKGWSTVSQSREVCLTRGVNGNSTRVYQFANLSELAQAILDNGWDF